MRGFKRPSSLLADSELAASLCLLRIHAKAISQREHQNRISLSDIKNLRAERHLLMRELQQQAALYIEQSCIGTRPLHHVPRHEPRHRRVRQLRPRIEKIAGL